MFASLAPNDYILYIVLHVDKIVSNILTYPRNYYMRFFQNIQVTTNFASINESMNRASF